jgi:hypothetical protein
MVWKNSIPLTPLHLFSEIFDGMDDPPTMSPSLPVSPASASTSSTDAFSDLEQSAFGCPNTLQGHRKGKSSVLRLRNLLVTKRSLVDLTGAISSKLLYRPIITANNYLVAVQLVQAVFHVGWPESLCYDTLLLELPNFYILCFYH